MFDQFTNHAFFRLLRQIFIFRSEHAFSFEKYFEKFHTRRSLNVMCCTMRT